MKIFLCKNFPDSFITMLDYKCELNLTYLLKHLSTCEYCLTNIEAGIKHSDMNLMNKAIITNFFQQIKEEKK